MPDQSEPGTRRPEPEVWRRGWLLDPLLLTAVCLIAYFIGLTNHGLTNWQESQRALAAREMQQTGGAGAWLVPTINQQPYLAKPPMAYWCQLMLAKALGRETGELELRLTVALAGLAGVLATYVVVRRVLSSREQSPDGSSSPVAREGALWSALFLATGTLYVRSSRIGELDILLAPFVVIAVGAVVSAWLSWRERGRVAYGSLVVAMLAATGAAMTKGPPALAVIAAAGYGPMVLDAILNGPPDASGKWCRIARRVFVATCVPAAAVFTVFEFRRTAFGEWDAVGKVGNVVEGIGAAIIVVICGVLAHMLARALTPPAPFTLARVFARTHPIAVLGVPSLVFWGWGRLVSDRIGPEAASFWAQKEAEDNLNVLVPISPIKNLEAMSFGVGVGSAAAVVAAVWLATRRPKLTVAWLVPIAWVGFGFAIFSLLGKGIGRYLTPLWPGVAMLGGVWLAHALATDRHARRTRAVVAAIVLVIACVSGWWYGFGRETHTGARSPRAMVGELLASGVRPDRLASFEFRTAAIDFYARHRVVPVGDIQIRDVTAGGKPWTIEELRADIAANGERVVFMREKQLRNDGRDPRPVADRLREAGLTVSPIESLPRFTIDTGKSEVVAARVSAQTR